MANTKSTDNRARGDLDDLEEHLESQLARVRQVRELLLSGDRAGAVNALQTQVYLDVTKLASARITVGRALERSLEE